MSMYFGPPPPSGTIHSITWYGSAMSQVLQCTQLAKLITGPAVRSPPGGCPGGHSYTAAGQKCWHGLPYSTVQRSTQIAGSRTTRCGGWSSSCIVPDQYTSVSLSIAVESLNAGRGRCDLPPLRSSVRVVELSAWLLRCATKPRPRVTSCTPASSTPAK